MASRLGICQRFAFASHAVRRHHRRRGEVLEGLEGRVVLAMFTVNSLGDAGSGSKFQAPDDVYSGDRDFLASTTSPPRNMKKALL